MSRFYNRTRRSASIPRSLVRSGRVALLPLYYAARCSDLAREAIEHSGSAQFADHIYANRPSGRFGIGALLDALFLSLPSARAFRTRYVYARRALERLLGERDGQRPTAVLAVPCGLARELFDVAPQAGPAVQLHGMDLDAELVDQLRRRAADRPAMHFFVGDALSPAAYPPGIRYDMIISLGFTEFLDDESAARFFAIAASKLADGGAFVTSGLRRHGLSDFFLRQVAELDARYRGDAELRRLAQAAGFTRVATEQDKTGLLTTLVGSRD